MLTDTQFESLLERISINQQDRERLIRIETIVTMNRENSEKCKLDLNSRIVIAQASAEKAHSRIDEEGKRSQRFAGGIASLAICIVIVEIILKLTGKL